MRNFQILTLAAIALLSLQQFSICAKAQTPGKTNPAINASCKDQVPGEIIVKMKSGASVTANANSANLSNSRSRTSSSFNPEDDKAVESFLKINIPGLKNLNLEKPLQVNNSLARSRANNFTSSNKSSLITNSVQRVTPTKIETLRNKYGFNRIYKLNTDITDCSQVNKILFRLKANPNVEYAEPNMIFKINNFANDPLYKSQGEIWERPYHELWGLKNIKADLAWSLSTGQGVVVAVIDTGVDYNHPDLWDNIWVDPSIVSDRNNDGKINLDDADLDSNKLITEKEIVPGMFGYDYVGDDKNPSDLHGHGTHVAGTISAVRNNLRGIVGVAPDAKILILKGLSDQGSGDDPTLANAVMAAADIYAAHPNLKGLITNNSWGGFGSSMLIKDAFDYAKDMGVINIAAAGNASGHARDFYPAGLSSTITVAASDNESNLAGFSNYGFSVDVAAPGVEILSTLGRNTLIGDAQTLIDDNQSKSTDYAYIPLDGTSMAAPHVAAAAALIKSLHPEYTQEDIRSIFRNKTSPINSDKINVGIIDVKEAVSATSVPPKAFIHTNIEHKVLSSFISFSGTASAKNFSYFTFEYTSDLDNTSPKWIKIAHSNSQVEEGLLIKNFDSLRLPNGDIKFKLTVYDQSGISSEYIIIETIKNNIFKSPIMDESSTTTVGATILPVIINLEGRKNYPISLELLNNQTGSIVKDILIPTGLSDRKIANLNTKLLPNSGLYTINVTLDNKASQKTQFLYEAKLSTSTTRRFTHNNFFYDIFFISSVNNSKVVDFDKDGIDDILVGDGKVVIYNNQKILIDHTFEEGVEAYGSPLAGDLDGDGINEIICNVANENVIREEIRVLDYKGNELSEWTTGLGVYSSVMLDNLTTSKKTDILSITRIADKSGKTNTLLNILSSNDKNVVTRKTHILESSNKHLGDYYGKPILADLNNDGNNEIILLEGEREENISGNNILLYDIKIFSLTGKLLKQIKTELSRGLADTAMPQITAVNLDNDIELELLVFGIDGEAKYVVAAYNHDGSIVSGWPFVIDQYYNPGCAMSELTIADLDNDGKVEILFGITLNYASFDNPSLKSYIYALNNSGKVLKNFPIVDDYLEDGETYVDLNSISAPVGIIVANIDNDKDNEIIVAKESSLNARHAVYAYNIDGSLVNNFPLHAAHSMTSSSVAYDSVGNTLLNSMAFGNFDTDKNLELVYIDKLDYLYVYDLDVLASTNIEWGMHRADINNTGIYSKNKFITSADLSVSLSADKLSLKTGEILSSNIIVANSSKSKGVAYGVTTSLKIPEGLVLLTKDKNCNINKLELICNFDPLSPGQAITKNLKFRAVNSSIKLDLRASLGPVIVSANRKVTVDPNLNNNKSNLVNIVIPKISINDIIKSIALYKNSVSFNQNGKSFDKLFFSSLTNKFYFLLPTGSLYESSTDKFPATIFELEKGLIALLNTSYYSDIRSFPLLAKLSLDDVIKAHNYKPGSKSSTFFNWTGSLYEKWFGGQFGFNNSVWSWSYMTADGSIYLTDGKTSLTKVPVMKLDTLYFTDPSKFSSITLSSDAYFWHMNKIDIKLNTYKANYDYNWSGIHKEKWLIGTKKEKESSTAYYYLLPDGRLYRFKSNKAGMIKNDVLVAIVDKKYYQDPRLIVHTSK